MRLQQVLLEARELQLQITQGDRIVADALEQAAMRVDQCEAATVELGQQLAQALLGFGVTRCQAIELGEFPDRPLVQLLVAFDKRIELLRPVLGERIGEVLRQTLQGAEKAFADQQARGRGGNLSGVVLQAADRHQAGTGHQHEQGDECGDQQIKARQEAEPKEGKTRMDGHDSSWRDSERDDLLLSRQNRPGRDYTHPPPVALPRRSTQA